MTTRQILHAALPAVAVVLVVAALDIGIGIGRERAALTSTGTTLDVEGALPSLGGATEWLNSPPLSSLGLRGKVVLVEFGTYTCINWRRTLPYIRAWTNKYEDDGLVVIGVHTPEFSFEKVPENVRREIPALDIHYPIAVDSDYAIWRAFRNQYWPAVYVADAQGRVRHHQFGEGGYEETERAIQRLLTEAGQRGVPGDLVSIEPKGAEIGADWATLQSRETYLGYENANAESFASPGDAARDRERLYAAPDRLRLNEWALVGSWTISPEAAALKGATGRIVYLFHARDVNLIMGAMTRGVPVRFRVRIDGKPPGVSHGIDIDEEGYGVVTQPRMYQLIRQRGPIADRVFDIEFLGSGVEAFDFTFG